jgi:predicted acylesterase/phospholipase RssA
VVTATTTVLAEMSGADLAIVVVTGCSIVAVVAIVVALGRLLSSVRALQASLEELNAQVTPLVDDLRVALEEANEELDRIDRLVGSAESISATVDATSKLAYRALSAPVIKTVAVTSGASRAARRLRRDR